MRFHVLHSLVGVAFVALIACGGKTLPSDSPEGADSGPGNDGTCTNASEPICGTDPCGGPLIASCSSGAWTCVPEYIDDCDISPPPDPIDGSISLDASVGDTGIYPYDATTTQDGGVRPDASGIPCGDETACPTNMFCQEQSDFTFQCAAYPAACENNRTCNCILDYGYSACPQEFGWSCGTDSVGDLEWACTAP